MNRLSSALGALAVIAIAVVFIIQFRPATGPSINTGPTCVAEVRGNCILTTHYWAAYRLILPRNADPAKLRNLKLHRQAADGLIERWLLNQDAKRLGLAVSDADVTRELAGGRAHVSVPADQLQKLGLTDDLVVRLQVKSSKTKKFDPKTYEKEIRNQTKLSPEDFREFQRQEIVATRMRDLIRSRAQVGDEEAHDRYVAKKTTATVDYVRLDPHFYADLAVDKSPKAVEAWAESNKEQVDKVWDSQKAQILPECRIARHILVKLDMRTADDEAKARARKRIQRAIDRVKAGEDFGDVARAMSDDTSAPDFGLLGCVPKGKMVKPFEDAVFALEAGKVSDIVETEYGYHVIKLDQIAKGDAAEKAGRAQVSRLLYLSQEATRLAAEGAKQILAAVRGGKSLKDALDAHLAEVVPKKPASGDKADKADRKKDPKKGDAKAGDKDEPDHAPLTAETDPNRPTVETSLPFNVGGDPIPGARSSSEVTKAAFALAKAGDVPNDVIPLDNGGFAVFQLKEKTPASKEEWEKNRDAIVGQMRADKETDVLVGYLARLKSTLGSEVKYPNPAMLEEPKGKEKDDGQPVMPDDDGE